MAAFQACLGLSVCTFCRDSEGFLTIWDLPQRRPKAQHRYAASCKACVCAWCSRVSTNYAHSWQAQMREMTGDHVQAALRQCRHTVSGMDL